MMTASRWKSALLVVCAVVLLLPLRLAFSQMTGSGRAAVSKRPLPEGMKAPLVRFEDLAVSAGLTGVNVSGSDRQQDYIVENTGNGAAIFDYDNDGLPDVFLVSADRFDKPPGQKVTHHLYHNLGHLRFEDVTEKSGITHTDWGQGVCAGDVDNDGKIDLFVTAWGSIISGTTRATVHSRMKRWSAGSGRRNAGAPAAHSWTMTATGISIW